MAKETPFSALTRKMLDNWLKTDPERPVSPDVVYRDVLDLLSIKMRLTVFTIKGDDPKRWFMKAIRHSGFTSRVLNINKIFTDSYIGDFKDQTYMDEAVIPRLLQVLDSQQPSMELVKTKLFGINLGYDRILLPQRNVRRPEWIISSSYAQFLLSPPQQQEKLDVGDEAIVQLLIEGATAKEIAVTLDVSHRTIEHRLERLKQRYGARNIVHLVSMLIATHLDQSR
ncbi:helix-turn-helix transcriptional regulator [Rhizobium sp. R72]|uniref:helix-turn-helix transcriptional regulator n=1 Tax=unclassified Rhizobium TaxID=2613769 RepID=UPI000B52EC53|nr:MULTISPECIES: helix-turn-helix transcriptional regulator [unclassified Rhizobium]OWW04584.1 helix-turn-helix transcriptional regulator [Rhizobium sp. R72]OWW05641.1 helix-turn-helix transcriptional regulator [Rhizobium sp. R711]